MDRPLVAADLAAHGLTRPQADLSVELIVTAFGWALLQRMGITNFPLTLRLRPPDADDVVFHVSDVHLFTAALGLAVEVFESGYTERLPKEGVSAVVAYSADVGAVSQALDRDPTLDRSACSLGETIYWGFSVLDFVDAAGAGDASAE